MKRVELNDFPMWSAWPSRLLGLAPWLIPRRTIEKIEEEYEKDKYAKCLEYWTSTGGNASAEEINRFEYGLNSDAPVCISLGNDLYEMSLGEARTQYYEAVTQRIYPKVEKCNTVVELGAGYGYNLWRLKQTWADGILIGGEYSKAAVRLASKLYKEDSRIRITYFNFYESEAYELLDSIDASIIIITVHALEQLPTCGVVFDYLMKYKEKVQAILHFEPVHEIYDKTLLGLMRSRYTVVNNYNVDILSELKRRSDIKIVGFEENFIGLNPLVPTSFLEWEFIR